MGGWETGFLSPPSLHLALDLNEWAGPMDATCATRSMVAVNWACRKAHTDPLLLASPALTGMLWPHKSWRSRFLATEKTALPVAFGISHPMRNPCCGFEPVFRLDDQWGSYVEP